MLFNNNEDKDFKEAGSYIYCGPDGENKLIGNNE